MFDACSVTSLRFERTLCWPLSSPSFKSAASIGLPELSGYWRLFTAFDVPIRLTQLMTPAGRADLKWLQFPAALLVRMLAKMHSHRSERRGDGGGQKLAFRQRERFGARVGQDSCRRA